ncbi:MAG: ABC transporter permease [Acidobacteria bacterium]|nr:ABC transporter permease [Acidobacteriota bacterium]
MSTLRFAAAEAWYEFRAGCRGPLIPIAFPGLIAYLMLVLLSADNLRDYGATDVPRNSPHLVYLMIAGQAIWLLFVWAWLFAQVVVRDRAASLHEMVLSAPISLRALLAARYLGAVGLACVLSLATGIGFLLVPPLGALGVFPPDTIGPQPFFAIGHALLILTLPSAVGTGALFLCATIRTRGVGGPFACAAAIMLVWMVAMVVVRGADADPAMASLLDPSAFAEVEEQSNLWTPREKAAGVLEMTPPLLANRLLWTFPGLLLLIVVLRRVERERLTLERAPPARGPGRAEDGRRVDPGAPGIPPLGPPARPSWPGATWSEAAWHFTLSFRGWAAPLALLILAAMGVGGAFVHVVFHADGPLHPRPHLVGPLLIEFYYLIIVFLVAGFVGTMARRDDRAGYGEVADATPAPLGSRVASRALAAAAVTVLFALTPVLSVWIVVALAVPDAFSLLDPVLYFGLLLAPSLLEVCALVLLAHALIRHAGAAHAAGVIFAFFIVINNELGVTTYPPAQVGVPPGVTLSEFSGWGPWLGYVLTADLFKVVVAAVLVAVAWLAWPRGTALTVPLRWRTGARRLVGRAGALAAGTVALAVGLHTVLHDRLVSRGGYESAAAETADDAAWEARWWGAAAPFAVAGGEATIAIDAAARRATARWRLDGVRSSSRTLHGSLPHGAEIARAAVDGREAPVTVALDHFAVVLDGCGPTGPGAERDAPATRVPEPSGSGTGGGGAEEEGCTVELEVVAHGDGWSAEGESPWLHPSGVWLRAADLLPALGHDPDRLVRAPDQRAAHRLDPVPGDVAAGALAPAAGVAPAGDWRWSVTFAGAGRDAGRPDGTRLAATGRTAGPLDFAAAWWPGAPIETRRGGVTALHGPQRARDVGGVLDDVREMRNCVEGTLGSAPAVRTVLQAPRERGETTLYGDLLWLPEHEGWDIAGESFGRWRRRATIASALAARHVADGADLRREPGEDWLRIGVPGWIGLECVRREDGADAWLALQARASDQVVEALGALDAPAAGVASAGDAPWVREYTPLATVGWVESVGPAAAVDALGAVVAGVRAGAPLAAALAEASGPGVAEGLLGPPASSDILVSRAAERTLEIAGQRWVWRDGGWEPIATEIHVTQRFDDGSGDRRRLGPVPATVEPDAPFTLIDAWPSFERTPSDNVWRGGGE